MRTAAGPRVTPALVGSAGVGSARVTGAPKAGPASSFPHIPGSWRSWLWLAVPLLFVAVFFAYPLAQIGAQSFQDKYGAGVGLANWQYELSSAAVQKATAATLKIAALSTLGALLLGTFIALALSFVPFRGAGLVTRLIETVVSFPSFLIPLAFSILYGRTGVVNSVLGQLAPGLPALNFVNDVPGVVLAEVAFYTPFVVRPLLAVFSQLPRELLDVAGSLGSGPLAIVRTVILPAGLPALAASAGLTFLLTMNEFGIILFTGAKNVMTLPMLIYTRSIVTFDMPSAAVIACIQVALSLGVYCLYRWTYKKLSGANHAAPR
ncbi:2-aminoethylphosphonate transport system permease protein [Arthrobacter silviterrae]|uniref:2-aminoethylphosphonate ABC transporter permease subunit n=1 Tax=Arthrobacter silviterrae TaxID=2026658 RepID=A0ABX0DKU3_9MICC|nr:MULTISPECIES: 2-aminoethylphosphonate ABC transporter permease subunit [Arthrobacter]MCU6481114.1 2-aminoethylphosphonate ABC transporter permease subunit [Arthrobacter sp. A2-55]MDQ0278207.1 2-aminoethylphosphonate transport system permease protein [Arthrobacter silviterrae]NGN84888.1 2-aminoethylphosphonate ABC transporter permease subunit [Arthrobacter silviterrae]